MTKRAGTLILWEVVCVLSGVVLLLIISGSLSPAAENAFRFIGMVISFVLFAVAFFIAVTIGITWDKE